jgi:hypothetical protein
MEEIIYLILISFFSIIIYNNFKSYFGIEGMTLTESKKREFENSKVKNAKEFHYSAKVNIPKTETKLNNIQKIYNSLKKKYDEFTELKKTREKLYKKIHKMAYPDDADGEEKDEKEESLCEKNPNQPGCSKLEAPGDYKKVQGEIAKDDADPEKGEIPNSINSWSGG